jgi:hypothetical protein
MRSLVIIIILVVASITIGCFNECNYWEKCDGNILLICGSGVDHIVGRKIREHPCTGENPICVEQDEHAYCVNEPLEQCDPEFTPRCDGDNVKRCTEAEGGYVYTELCPQSNEDAGNGPTCDERGAGAACVF